MSSLFSPDTLAAVLFILFILQFRRISTFINLSKYLIRASVWSEIPRDTLPAHISHLLDCAASGLKDLGFEPVCTQAAAPFNAFDPRTRIYAETYWHPEKSVVARVGLAEAITGQTTKVQFQSLFEDGGLLITVNRERWASFPTPEGILFVDGYADDLAGQWQAHLDALAREAAQRTPVTDKAEALRQEMALGLSPWLEHMRQLGWIREESADCYAFTLRGAWGFSGQISRLGTTEGKALARPYRHEPTPELASARLAEMDSVAAILALWARPMPPQLKAALFVLTLVLSAILFGQSIGLLEAAALLAVLVLHELGHLAAMWIFGYRNLSIFFLPLLGAAATGHKPHAPPWQEAIVLLAGPLPGLVLAFALSQIPSDALPLPAIEFIRAWVWFSLFINLFNLLPIGVLDGGRLFELAVLGRFPRARAVFAALGVAAGIVFAISAQSLVMGVAMLLLLLALPQQFSSASAIAAIQATAGKQALDGEQALHALGLEFARKDYGAGSKGFLRRMGIARLAYPRLMQGVPGLGLSLGVLAGLMLSWTLPTAIMVWIWLQPEPQPLQRKTLAEQQESAQQRETLPEQVALKKAQEAFLARYQAEGDPAARWAMLDEHEDEDEEMFDESHWEWLTQQRAELLKLLPADHPGKLRHQLAQAMPGTAGSSEALLAVIAQLGGDNPDLAAKLDRARFDVLMEAYQRLAMEAPQGQWDKAKAALEGLWQSLATPGQPYAEYRATIASILGRMAFSAGKTQDAETWMARYHAENAAEGGLASLGYGWFLLDAGHPDQALALATQAIGKAGPQDPFLPQWHTLAGWAEMGQAHPREADTYFQAVLDQYAARLSKGFEGQPWWQGLLGRLASSALSLRRVNAPTLDHLAALEGYDPEAASKLSAEVAGNLARLGGTPPAINSRYDGWGQLREAAHGKLLQTLGAASTKQP